MLALRSGDRRSLTLPSFCPGVDIPVTAGKAINTHEIRGVVSGLVFELCTSRPMEHLYLPLSYQKSNISELSGLVREEKETMVHSWTSRFFTASLTQVLATGITP